ncbi:unnamed protein product [Lactuca virosa]|uniref:Uncharacterized protein n=1 Tax=Lactuca virosa TaxID=75947 RepID=A0AAU9PRA5_9ASTR|nr:unnamed protein product [Lactuca virosa]
MLVIIDEPFSHLKAQAPTAEAYDALSKQINMSFQRVLEWLNELQGDARLASDVGHSNAIGGEGVSKREIPIQWKHVSEFVLEDELFDEEILEVENLEPLELGDEEDEDLVENAILGL